MVIFALCAAGLFGTASCRGPLYDGALRFDPQRFREAESIELGPMSTSPPVEVEEATRQVLREVVSPQPPASTMELSLADVRGATLHGNLELQAELFNPTIAESRVREEEARFEWTFFGSARRISTDQATPSLLDAPQSTIENYNLGVQIPVQTGGTVTVDLPFDRLETDSIFSTLNPSYDAALRFSISQPLLRGAGIRANTNGIRVAAMQSQIVDAQTKLSAIRVLAAADKSYWDLYAAQEELKVRQQQYELSVDQLERARRLVNAGTGAAVDVVRAEAGVADSLSGIIIADTAVKLRRRELKKLMNREDLPMGGPTELILSTVPHPVGLDLDSEELAARAVTNRMEMLELELRLAIDASNLDFERNQALPLFLVDYTYSRDGQGSDFGAAFSQITDRSFENWTLGARVEIPLGNEAAKARVHRAILNRVQTLATRDQRRQSIRQEVFDALDRLQQDWQRILAARQQTVLAARTYEAEKRQFELGLRTSTDVFDALTRLANARSQEVRALADYQRAQVDIAFATGTLLGSGRVEWVARDAPEADG
jgi:outer membrane protein TolC